MLKRSFLRSLPMILAVWVYMLRTLVLPHNVFRVIGVTETLFPILIVPVCAFILYDRTEIELSLVCGTRSTKLFFTKLIPLVVYTLIPVIAFLFILPSETDMVLNTALIIKGAAIPDYVPENYRFYVVISMIVTLSFFVALYSLVRVITRNCFVPMFICFGLGVGITNLGAKIVSWKVPLTRCLFDPMIGTYFIGNEVPAAYAVKYPELAGMVNIWTYNRLLFVGISALLFFITYLILRREKLHCGIGE